MELIFGTNLEPVVIGTLRIMALTIFLVVNLAYLFAIDAPRSVTVMVTNVATAVGALVNFVLWTTYTITDIGAMVLVIFAALGMALVASETHKHHNDKRTIALHNPVTGIFVVMALLGSWLIGSAAI